MANHNINQTLVCVQYTCLVWYSYTELTSFKLATHIYRLQNYVCALCVTIYTNTYNYNKKQRWVPLNFFWILTQTRMEKVGHVQ